MSNLKNLTLKDLKASDFPPALRPLYNNSPESVRPLLITVALVCWMALGTRLRVNYVMDMYRSMLCVNLLCIGPSGQGKSLVRWLVQKIIFPTLKARDNEERRREQQYSDERRKKGSNKDKPDEPLTVIRYQQSITVPKLVKRADFMVRRYGDPLTFFVYTDELATMCGNSRSNREEYNAIARSAYQENEIYIRETLYQDGYNAAVDINWCSIMCGQDYALDKYIDKAGLLLGDASRQILFSLESMGERAPKIKTFTEEEERMMDEVTQRLMRETYNEDDTLGPIHTIDMEWIDKDVYRWCDDKANQIVKNGSHALECFYKRSSSSAFRIASAFYYIWGEEANAQKHVRRCYYAYANTILGGLMKKWGKKYEQALPMPEEEDADRPTLYDQMPKRFTREQLKELIDRLEIKTPARSFICRWQKKKLIYRLEGENEVFEKLY